MIMMIKLVEGDNYGDNQTGKRIFPVYYVKKSEIVTLEHFGMES